MVTSQYSPPINQLFTYGNALDNIGDWSGYLNLGITTDHIPDLIQMITDESLYELESEEVEIWGVTHAWRLLAELKAEAAIPALVSVVRRWADSAWTEWMIEEVPRVFEAIGTASIPALTELLADATEEELPRTIAAIALGKIGRQYPDSRTQCVEVLTQQLQAFTHNDEELNASLIYELIELKAVESAAVIEQAFQLNCVDEMVVGDWDEVQVDLGLKTREEVPMKRFYLDPPIGRERHEPVVDGFGGNAKDSKTKAKRKQQKESRRKNRKKK